MSGLAGLTALSGLSGEFGGASGGGGGGTPPDLTDAVFYYKFENTSWADSGSGGNALTGVNGPTSVTGKLGNSARFVAASHQALHCTYNSAFDMSGTSFTIACWVYFDSLTSFARICYKGKSDVDVDWLLGIDGSNQLIFDGSNASRTHQGVTAVTHGPVSTGTWYFVVAQIDTASGGHCSISVDNGTADTSFMNGGVANDDSFGFYVGADSDGTTYDDWLDGRVDSLGGWKRLLSGTEIDTLFNSGAGSDPV